MRQLPLTGALATVAAVLAATALGGTQPLAITSSIDGATVLPQQSHWMAHPNVAAADVSEVDFLIDGQLRWVEHHAPYYYGGDDGHGHAGYLFTSWLTPGQHEFVARVRTSTGATAKDTVTARVVDAPAPPSTLAGTWMRTLTSQDAAKSSPKYGVHNVPPTGTWHLVIDRTGIWELDPKGGGIVQADSVSGNVLHTYAPIEMLPTPGNGNTGSFHRFGHRIGVNGGIDCDDSGPFGTYHWSAAGNHLTLTAMQEPCGQRRAVYEGTWTRVG